MSNYDEDILEGLTDEERAALEEDETETNDAEESDNEDADAEQDAGEAAGAGDGDDAGADDDTEGEPANSADQHAPLLIADAPENAEASLKEITSKKTDLVEQFDNGDITAKEYQNQLDGLNKEERSIERAVEKANLAVEMRQQQELNTWLGQVRDFTSSTHPEYSTSRVRWMALDTFVKEIVAKDPGLSGPEVLRQAHERVTEDLGAVAQPKGKAGKPLKGSRAKPPTTLAKVPASDNADIDDSRWSSLDRLRESDPLAHEERMMKLTDTERDEYLARA